MGAETPQVNSGIGRFFRTFEQAPAGEPARWLLVPVCAPPCGSRWWDVMLAELGGQTKAEPGWQGVAWAVNEQIVADFVPFPKLTKYELAGFEVVRRDFTKEKRPI